MSRREKSAGWMFCDKESNAIYAVSPTVDELYAAMRSEYDHSNPEGNQISPSDFDSMDAYSAALDASIDRNFNIHPATAALITKVEEDGGLVSWGYINGVACTEDEAYDDVP